MRLPCNFIVLFDCLDVIFVHVFHVDGVGRLAWDFFFSFALVWIDDRSLKLVRVVPVCRHMFLCGVNQRETLCQMVRYFFLCKICLSF